MPTCSWGVLQSWCTPLLCTPLLCTHSHAAPALVDVTVTVHPHRRQKLRETNAALEVLPDLFQELDQLPGQARLLALTEVQPNAQLLELCVFVCAMVYRATPSSFFFAFVL